MAYIKGIFINDIYTNNQNGYTVGLIRIKESSEDDKVNKVITFTGIFDELKYKATYKMEGSFGLVWDGTSKDTCIGGFGEYLKFNNPHKF